MTEPSSGISAEGTNAARTPRGLGALSFLNAGPLRGWFIPVLLCVLVLVLLRRVDAPINDWLAGQEQRLSGDVRRELSAWQQYGQGVCLFVVAAIMFLLDTGRRRLLVNYGAGVAITFAAVSVIKMLVGRVRPKHNDPDLFLGPWGQYPIEVKGAGRVLTHSWELGAKHVSELWSLPSSHTAMAFFLSGFLAWAYPRLGWVVWPLACVTAFGRLVFDAHWPTDVVVGAIVGIACARLAIGIGGKRSYDGA